MESTVIRLVIIEKIITLICLFLYIGQPEEQQTVTPAVKPTYIVGDRVKVCLEKDALIKLQNGHGGWNPRMVEYLSHTGTVHRITDKGDIR